MTSYPTVSCGPWRVWKRKWLHVKELRGRERQELWCPVAKWGDALLRQEVVSQRRGLKGMPLFLSKRVTEGPEWRTYTQKNHMTHRNHVSRAPAANQSNQYKDQGCCPSPAGQSIVQLTPSSQDPPPHPTPLAGKKEWKNKTYLLQTTDSEGHDLAREGREKRWEWVSNWTRQNFLIMRNDSKAVGLSQDVTEGQEREVVIGRERESFKSCTSMNIENSLYLIQS